MEEISREDLEAIQAYLQAQDALEGLSLLSVAIKKASDPFDKDIYTFTFEQTLSDKDRAAFRLMSETEESDPTAATIEAPNQIQLDYDGYQTLSANAVGAQRDALNRAIPDDQVDHEDQEAVQIEGLIEDKPRSKPRAQSPSPARETPAAKTQTPNDKRNLLTACESLEQAIIGKQYTLRKSKDGSSITLIKKDAEGKLSQIFIEPNRITCQHPIDAAEVLELLTHLIKEAGLKDIVISGPESLVKALEAKIKRDPELKDVQIETRIGAVANPSPVNERMLSEAEGQQGKGLQEAIERARTSTPKPG